MIRTEIVSQKFFATQSFYHPFCRHAKLFSSNLYYLYIYIYIFIYTLSLSLSRYPSSLTSDSTPDQESPSPVPRTWSSGLAGRTNGPDPLQGGQEGLSF